MVPYAASAAGAWRLAKMAGMRYGRNPYYKKASNALLSPRMSKMMKFGSRVYRSGAAGKIQRAYRSYRKTKIGKRMVPQDRTRCQAYQDAVPNVMNLFPMGTLQTDIIGVPLGASELTSVNRRTGIKAVIKGIKICRIFTYINVNIGTIEVNWALVQMKSPNATPTGIRFFRYNNDDNDRSRDFIDYGAGSLWDMGKNCLAMNPEYEFNILTRRKFMLNPTNFSTDLERPLVNIWKIEKYFPIKKRMHWQGNNDFSPANGIYEVYWYNTATTVAFPVNPIASSYLQTCNTNTVYFRDIP